jgi:hypothetical protein
MWGTVAISLVWEAVIVTAWYMIFLSYNRRQATLVFEFDLDFPPGFNLEVSNYRWCGRTTRNFYSQPADWHFAQTMPLVLTSRRHWEREVTSMMNALLSCRERQFLSLSCRSPHSPPRWPWNPSHPPARTSATCSRPARARRRGKHLPLNRRLPKSEECSQGEDYAS